MTPKTIFINGRFLTKTVTGVQRYARELLRAMDAMLAPAQDVRCICLAPLEKLENPGWKNIEIRPVGLNKGNLWEQVDLPFHARGGLLFSPANIGPFYYRNQVVTLHDASVFAAPQAYSWAFRAKYIFMFHWLARNARRLLTVSRFSQGELARYLQIPPQRFTVVAPGCDHFDRIQPDERILTQRGLERDGYLLIVASWSAHKNLGSVFEALQLLNAKVKVMVVGGSFGQVFRKTRAQALPANVETLGYVSDGQLKALYQNALGLVFPSTYEGFGLPVLEAMRCGCPVLCSEAASLPETAGEAALYFDPHRSEQLAGALDVFLFSPSLREELREKGYKHSARFQWAATARQTLETLLGGA